jgi:lysophospholipase L1-like esterase|tara:strand:+ start:43 stop:342 length:300 start_codon:yes stop_codon:yes gene_type:complete
LSNDFTKQKNSKLYFVYIVGYNKYSNSGNDKNVQNYKKIIKILKSLEIPIIDINKELFEKHEDPLSLFPFRMSGHYNEKGYQLVAQTIFNKIKILEKKL